MNIYQRLGATKISDLLTVFYRRAFVDPIIGHFFFAKDHQRLLEGQIAFTIAMLGGPKRYCGRSLTSIHQPLAIRNAHFNRRLILLREVFAEFGVDQRIAQGWLAKEQQLRTLIVK